MKTYIETIKNANGTHSDQANSFFDCIGVPKGWVEIPENLLPEWDKHKPFVNITVRDGAVASIADDVEARLAWEAANPEKPPEPTAEQDMMQMLVDLTYQVTLIELGVL